MDYLRVRPVMLGQRAESVPEFLSYLAQHHMGLMAWTLVPGVLVESANLADPTRIKK